MKRLIVALAVAAWALVAALGLAGIASVFLSIWYQSDQWGMTAFACIVIAISGGLGASGRTWIAEDKP